MRKLGLILLSLTVLALVGSAALADSIDMVIGGESYTCYKNDVVSPTTNYCECIAKQSDLTGKYWWVASKVGFKVDDGGKNGGQGTFDSIDEALDRCHNKITSTPYCYMAPL